MFSLTPRERVQLSIPRILDETVEVVRLVPQERVQPFVKENVNLVRLVPQGGGLWNDEQMVEVPLPQCWEDSDQIVDEGTRFGKKAYDECNKRLTEIRDPGPSRRSRA